MIDPQLEIILFFLAGGTIGLFITLIVVRIQYYLDYKKRHK